MSECSFSRAARRLGITQSAVSQAIARLRVVAGDELFERTGQGVRPTPRAYELDQPIRQAIGLLRSSFSSAAVFDPRTTERTFFMVMLPSVAEVLSMDLHNILMRSSKLRFYIGPLDRRDLRAGLRQGEPELALMREPVEAPGCRSELLCSEKVVMAARQRHPAITGPVTWDVYAGLDHVVLGLSHPTEQSLVDREFERRRVKRSVPMAMPTASALLNVVENTNLVLTLGELTASRFAARYNVEIHALPLSESTVPLIMNWHERYDNDRGHVWLRDQLRGLFRARPAEE